MNSHVLGLLTKATRSEDIVLFCRYYIKLGFDHIVIWDNESPADLSALEDHPLIEVRRVAGWPNQNKIFTEFSREAAGKHSWMYLTDDDEYLYLKNFHNIKQVTSRFSDSEGIAFNMVNIGYQHPPETRNAHFIQECLFRWDYSHPISRNIKSIVRPEKVVKYPNTHLPEGPIVVNMEGARVNSPLEGQVCYKAAWILHYVWQARDDYEEKSRRGLAATGGHRRMMGVEEFLEFSKENFSIPFSEFREEFNRIMGDDLL
jgi:hypothetical protein